MKDPPMQMDRWQRVQTLFLQAVELPESRRRPFLEEAAGGDAELLREVQELLKADAEVSSDSDAIAATVEQGELLLGSAPAQPEVLPPRFGKYEVEARLGEGGFGVVYRGRDPVLRRSVAIKTCTSVDTEIRRRFYREGRIAAGLRHPNITTVHELAVEEGIPFLVQELLDGEDLRDVIADGRAVPLKALISYLRQVAEGLEHAHGEGVLHRDVKPANIRILPDGTVKLMDFGIAKLLGAETGLTVTGTTLGTVGYLAPEQLRSEELDARADIFSFGVVAYELATGERPFQGKDFSQVSYQLLYRDPKPLLELWPECPPGLAQLIHHCLAKDPMDRPGSFAPIRRQLKKIADRSEDLPATREALEREAGEHHWLTETTRLSRSSWTRISARDLRLPALAVSAVVALLWLLPKLGEPALEEPRSSAAPAAAPETPAGQPTPTSAEPSPVVDGASPSDNLSPEPPTRAPTKPSTELLPSEGLGQDNVSQADAALDATVPEPGRSPELGSPTEPPAGDSPGEARIDGPMGEPTDDPTPTAPADPPPDDPGVSETLERSPSTVQASVPASGEIEGDAVDTVKASLEDSQDPSAQEMVAEPPAMNRGDLIARQGPGVVLPRLLNRPEPKYPRRARRRGIEQRVLVKVLVDENGRVVQAIAPGPDDHGFLRAAKDAALKATFEPATRDGIAGLMWTQLPFDFKLE